MFDTKKLYGNYFAKVINNFVRNRATYSDLKVLL